MGKCKYLRDGIESLVSGISRLVQKCAIRETPFNLLKLSKSSHVLKFHFTARVYLNWCKARHKGNKRQIWVTQNRLPGGLGLNHGNGHFRMSSPLVWFEFQRTDDHLKL
jgi:hypothetical protein